MRLLDVAALAAGDDPVVVERWYNLGVAYRVRWTLTHDRADIDAAPRHLDTAAPIARTDDERLRILFERVQFMMNAGRVMVDQWATMGRRRRQ